jgi:hypothetical protein
MIPPTNEIGIPISAALRQDSLRAASLYNCSCDLTKSLDVFSLVSAQASIVFC